VVVVVVEVFRRGRRSVRAIDLRSSKHESAIRPGISKDEDDEDDEVKRSPSPCDGSRLQPHEAVEHWRQKLGHGAVFAGGLLSLSISPTLLSLSISLSLCLSRARSDVRTVCVVPSFSESSLGQQSEDV
jgi:hypothetical protein